MDDIKTIPLCKCGCGSLVSKIGCVWCKGHHVRSIENRNKISKANTGKIRTEESKLKYSAANKGKILSEETKNKLSKSLKGKLPWNTGLNISGMTGKEGWNKGIFHTPETIEKMKKSHRENPRVGYKHSDETKQKLSDSLIGRLPGRIGPHTEETKKKISEKASGRPGYWKDKKLPKEMVNKRNSVRKMNGWVPWNKGKINCYTRESLSKMRISHYERLKKLFPDGSIVRSNIGDKEFIFFDLLKHNIDLDIRIQEPVDGYFIDFYIPSINLAIEFDETSGHTRGDHVSNDKIRECDIINAIGCVFYRIKEIDWDSNQEFVLLSIKNFIEQKLKEKT